jgi:hypothetical protein
MQFSVSDHLSKKGGQTVAPSGFNLQQLQQELADLK